MGKVQGVKEKLHYPIYDAFVVKNEPDSTKPKTFEQFMTDPRVIRFFIDIQNKTRLETNLQASGVLPSLNTFEARAMRVVVSSPQPQVTGNSKAMRDAAEEYGKAANKEEASKALMDTVRACYCTCTDASLILSELIYNSVTTLLVGEKIMIEMPTYFFPSGAGIHPGNSVVSNHGEPDPMATFRFAEPIIIEPQQNFRVEMSFPQGVPGQNGTPGCLAKVTGPLRIWVVLDGYLTRDVQ
jgi:hypothetical protein